MGVIGVEGVIWTVGIAVGDRLEVYNNTLVSLGRKRGVVTIRTFRVMFAMLSDG